MVKIAHVFKTRSNCMKKSVGAVLVDNNRRILSTRYDLNLYLVISVPLIDLKIVTKEDVKYVILIKL